MKCPICEREFEKLTKHHIIPKSKGGRTTILICSDCHRQIHAIFTRSELSRTHGLHELLNNSEFKKYVEWVRKKKPHSRIKVCRRRRT